MPRSALQSYGFDPHSLAVEEFGSGLINNTWKVVNDGEKYILQRINHAVFKEPEDIANNIRLIANYLKQHHPGYRFIAPVTTTSGDEMIFVKGSGYFRLFPFVSDSHSKDVVETTQQAREAAAQFGRFTRLLHGVDVKQLKLTIPFFHDLSLRYQQFLTALEKGNRERILESEALIGQVVAHTDIVTVFNHIRQDPEFKLRVTHHDTKISNVLFDKQEKGICVIDLDTVMPGYFISDVGDMMRTYLSPVSEEEQDFDKITVRNEFYKAIVEGYYGEMKDELAETEKAHFFYAGTFMIYMQALRFLTDYLNNDVYYGAKYPKHNLKRAKNQLVLLERLIENRKELEGMITL